MKRTLITSALPYANGYLHLGHCAGAYLPADLYARFLRMTGADTLWVCGSDEHGVAITIAADKEKVSPKEIIDKYHEANKEAFEKFGMTFDIYSRTSMPVHHETAREFFSDFLQKGLLVEREEEQFYDEQAGMFLPDRYVEGTCPNCGYDKARGDQCDSCGAYYNQLELKNPVSLVSGKTPVARKTIHWYMRFDMFQEFLENYIESHAPDWKDNVLQQTRSWLKQGLAERAITRDLNWGVKIDGIEGIPAEKAAGKVLYVWFEAVLGYISATKHLFGNSEWENWWKSPDTRYVAFIGKDNIVFHTLIFPALLHARGGYILPDNVPANEFLNLEGQKFSKSRNWSIDLRDFIADFPDPSAMDVLRYTLAMNFPETRDSDFTWKDFQGRNNSELAAIFGNFVNRTLQFVHKNFDGKVPELNDTYKDFANRWADLADALNRGINPEADDIFSQNDIAMLVALIEGIGKISSNYRRFRFRDAITETMNVARAANKYFNDEEPWKTLKNNPGECAKTLYVCCQLVNSLAILFAPIIPNTCRKISGFLNNSITMGEASIGRKYANTWDSAALPALQPGSTINNPEILFSRIEDDVIKSQMDKLGNNQPAQEALKEELLDLSDFMKIKLRTAVVLEAERVPKSKKLLRLMVDTGEDRRQIIAGIAEHYSPEEMVGRTIVVVVNLKPARLMGQESNGMLLAANSTDGKLTLVEPGNKEVGPGAEVR